MPICRVLTNKEIKKFLQSKKLIIDPFEENCLQPTSYDIRVGSYVLISDSPLLKHINTFFKKNNLNQAFGIVKNLQGCKDQIYLKDGDILTIEPLKKYLLHSLEKIEMPLNLCGDIWMRSSFQREGIFPVVQGIIEVGWKGNLTIEIVNLAPDSVKIKFGDRIATIRFYEVSEELKEGYSGLYQNSIGVVTSRRLL